MREGQGVVRSPCARRTHVAICLAANTNESAYATVCVCVCVSMCVFVCVRVCVCLELAYNHISCWLWAPFDSIKNSSLPLLALKGVLIDLFSATTTTTSRQDELPRRVIDRVRRMGASRQQQQQLHQQQLLHHQQQHRQQQRELLMIEQEICSLRNALPTSLLSPPLPHPCSPCPRSRC